VESKVYVFSLGAQGETMVTDKKRETKFVTPVSFVNKNFIINRFKQNIHRLS
jgi:hypothetical protein